ncbi:hypothetical protein DSOUD_2342 [Desulfuromonas soudanensis]|uniref:Uncharacterized protein n=1 Tax=Desulfuromonas soudanensis TaxID=1603606 RepID=A0A0M4CXT1_9BACT|nr:hypothetical protein [Desulfuromonas soudanensis]ALC17104.1 hypothetical protein DSOUD_2342 [Desulfuromonas soudanensis]
MRRLGSSLILWIFLSGAAPVPVLTPERPCLGSPLLVAIPLPDSGTELIGLPDLGSFALLAPPRRSEGELQILLLPMRPGLQTLPSFPLTRGRSRQWATEPLELAVNECLDAESVAAPLMDLPPPEEDDIPLWPLLLLTAAALLLGLLWRLARIRRLLSGQKEEGPVTRLAALQRRLDLIPDDSAERRLLEERLERLRFAPGVPSEEEIEEAAAAIETLEKEGR